MTVPSRPREGNSCTHRAPPDGPSIRGGSVDVRRLVDLAIRLAEDPTADALGSVGLLLYRTGDDRRRLERALGWVHSMGPGPPTKVRLRSAASLQLALDMFPGKRTRAVDEDIRRFG